MECESVCRSGSSQESKMLTDCSNLETEKLAIATKERSRGNQWVNVVISEVFQWRKNWNQIGLLFLTGVYSTFVLQKIERYIWKLTKSSVFALGCKHFCYGFWQSRWKKRSIIEMLNECIGCIHRHSSENPQIRIYEGHRRIRENACRTMK